MCFLQKNRLSMVGFEHGSLNQNGVNNKSRKKTQYSDIRNRTCRHDLRINASPLPCQLVYEGTWAANRSIAFTSVLLSEDSEMPLT
jgi:hypothetical protein